VSKNYPENKRRYDLYLAVDHPLQIGQVIFAPHGHERIVIREAYAYEEWMRQRAVDRGWISVGTAADTLSQAREQCQMKPAPNAPVPAECGNYYGADYLPTGSW